MFSTKGGHALSPRHVGRAFKNLAAAADLAPDTHIHQLRHTHATLLLAEGVPVKVVSERLGHSSISVTLRVYSHVLPGMQAQAALAFARRLTAPEPDDGESSPNAKAPRSDNRAD